MNEPLAGPGRRFFIVDEERLRALILDLSPDIRRDTLRMGDLIREMVAFERSKLGLDNPRGTLELYPNKEKNHPAQPDILGTGQVAGRSYQAAGWFTQTNKLKIALLPQKQK